MPGTGAACRGCVACVAWVPVRVLAAPSPGYTDAVNELPRLTTDLERCKADLERCGYCLLADALPPGPDCGRRGIGSAAQAVGRARAGRGLHGRRTGPALGCLYRRRRQGASSRASPSAPEA